MAQAMARSQKRGKGAAQRQAPSIATGSHLKVALFKPDTRAAPCCIGRSSWFSTHSPQNSDIATLLIRFRPKRDIGINVVETCWDAFLQSGFRRVRTRVMSRSVRDSQPRRESSVGTSCKWRPRCSPIKPLPARRSSPSRAQAPDSLLCLRGLLSPRIARLGRCKSPTLGDNCSQCPVSNGGALCWCTQQSSAPEHNRS